MINYLYKKGFVFTTVVLFVGLCFVPNINGAVGSSTYDMNEVWTSSNGGGRFIFPSFINDDDVPDIFVEQQALDGRNGDCIWEADYGIVFAVGDIDNDNIDEVILSEGIDVVIHCLSIKDGDVKWQRELDSAWIYSVSIGNVTGNENSEVVVGVGDYYSRGNNYVYCLDGITGNVIWRKHTGDYVNAVEIDDVNADGKNEVIAVTDTNDPCVYCLDGVNGNIIWNVTRTPGYYFRSVCIGDLNDDPYKEILVEWGFGIACIHGNNGSINWIWQQDLGGSFQSIQIADMIPGIPGNEIIAGSAGGVFCIKGSDQVQYDREIWHFGDDGVLRIIMYATTGDINGDGLLEVVAISSSGYGESGLYMLDGHTGYCLWVHECGNDNFEPKCIICPDLTIDGIQDIAVTFQHGGEGHTSAFSCDDGSDLDCDGSLSWIDVTTGTTVDGSFTVENVGDPLSMLGWNVDLDELPDWGTWTFTPLSGNDLTPESGKVTVEVSVVVPAEQNDEFNGEIKIVNRNDPNDFCIINVYLSTPYNGHSLSEAYSNFAYFADNYLSYKHDDHDLT